MRLVTAPLAVGALALLLFLPTHDRGRALSLHGPAAKAKGPVPALVSRWDGTRLTAVDEETLRPVGRPSALLGFVDTWAFSKASPSLLAAATRASDRDEQAVLRFVNVASRRLVKRTVPLGGYARALLWARPDRVVAIVGDCCSQTSRVVVVDPGARRVLSRSDLPGSISLSVRGRDSLVLLLTPSGQIGPATLAVVAADGSVRSVALGRVSAGTVFSGEDTGDPVGKTRIPGLAVDRDGGRAYVIQPDGPAAVVDLATLTVSYHDLSGSRSLVKRLAAWLTPAAQAKGANGPTRAATWLGDGLIAVTGVDEHAARNANGTLDTSMTPAGLAIVDTRDWTIRSLDPGADSATPVDGLLLATGSRWSTGESQPKGMGLAAYGADRSLRFHVLAGRAAGVVTALAGRAYVSISTDTGAPVVEVVDLAAGKVVGERSSDLPTLLLGDGPAW